MPLGIEDQFLRPMKFSEKLGTVIEAEVEFLQHHNSLPRVSRFSSDILPWLSLSNADVVSYWEIEQARLEAIFGNGKSLKDIWQAPEPIVELVETAIVNYFRDLGIDASPSIRVQLVECDQGALGDLEFPDNHQFTLKRFEDVAFDNATSLVKGDLKVSTEEAVVVSLSQSSRTSLVSIVCKKNVEVEEVILRLGNKDLARCAFRKIMVSPLDRIPVPEVPLRCFPVLGGAWEFSLFLKLRSSGSSKEIDLGALPVKVDEYADGVVDLFIDMGSTYTKYIEATYPLGLDECDESKISEARAELGRYLAGNEGDVEVHLPEEKDTRTYLSETGVREFDKERLLTEDAAGLSNWFESAVRDLVSFYAGRGQILNAIFWSFPTDEGFADQVSESVSAAVSERILGRFCLVPESISLRYRFADVLRLMSDLANTNQEERQISEAQKLAAQQGKAVYDSQWLKRLNPFESSPPDPTTIRVPRRIAELEVFLTEWDEESSPFAVLDAGGATLDVYAESDGRFFTKSFKAGGKAVTSAVRKEMAAIRGKQSNQIPLGDAEKQKRKDAPKTSGGRYYKRICEETERIYAPPIDEVVRWIEENIATKDEPILLVLTGGAMNTAYLRDNILGERVRELNAIQASSQWLCELLTKSGVKGAIGNQPAASRFRRVSHMLDEDRFRSRSSFDIVGGLVEKGLQADY